MLPYVACCLSRIELKGPILFVAVLEMPSAPHGAVRSPGSPGSPVQAIPAWWALSAIEFGLLSMGSPKYPKMYGTKLFSGIKANMIKLYIYIIIYIYIKLM
jgi:hypothetical protein